MLLHGKGDKLSSKAKYWSLFCLVGLPYLAHKADHYVTQLQSREVRPCATIGYEPRILMNILSSLVRFHAENVDELMLLIILLSTRHRIQGIVHDK